jgi:hypothetical protein
MHLRFRSASFLNCPILDNLRMATAGCYLVTLALVYLSSVVLAT